MAPVAAALPVADPTRRIRVPTAHFKPEGVIKSKARKARGKTAKVGIHIRDFYAVRITDNIKPKRPRRDLMEFAYRYVVDGK